MATVTIYFGTRLETGVDWLIADSHMKGTHFAQVSRLCSLMQGNFSWDMPVIQDYFH